MNFDLWLGRAFRRSLVFGVVAAIVEGGEIRTNNSPDQVLTIAMAGFGKAASAILVSYAALTLLWALCWAWRERGD